jgi:hypothetical protein
MKNSVEKRRRLCVPATLSGGNMCVCVRSLDDTNADRRLMVGGPASLRGRRWEENWFEGGPDLLFCVPDPPEWAHRYRSAAKEEENVSSTRKILKDYQQTITADPHTRAPLNFVQQMLKHRNGSVSQLKKMSTFCQTFDLIKVNSILFFSFYLIKFEVNQYVHGR